MITKKRSQEIFLDLARIYSPSGKEDRLAGYIMDFFRSLGKRIKRDKAGNVIIYLPGKGDPLLLSAHMDTLISEEEIKPVVKKRTIQSSSGTILGITDKAGITAILCAAEHLIKKAKPNRPLELVFTVRAETDHYGAFNLNFKKLRSSEAIVIDDCGKLGSITLSSPYLYEIEIRIKGRAVHVGELSGKGINALQVASKAIGEIRLGRVNAGTTINLGLIQGGEDASFVPGEIILKGEVRSLKQDKALDHIDRINKVFKKYVRRHGAKLYFRSRLLVRGYEHKRSDKLIRSLTETNKEFKFNTVFQKASYITDTNVFNYKGLRSVNISFGGHGARTGRERIKVDELKALAEYLVVYSLI